MSDMLNQVDVTIQIAGTTCDYETLTLHQSMHGHHHFEVLVNYKPNKPSLWSTTLETVFEQLGEWFYYDGQKLILGNPKREDTTRAAFCTEPLLLGLILTAIIQIVLFSSIFTKGKTKTLQEAKRVVMRLACF